MGDNARAAVLSALMSGCAHTATELADAAGVTRQTVSSHLAKLLDAGLIEVDRQGRHRYFRLAGAEVAELLESMMGLAAGVAALDRRFGPRDPTIRKARVCYDHLAGELGVFAYAEMLRHGLLRSGVDGLQLTSQGRTWFERFGIDTRQIETRSRPLCRACLDWSERRHHLAGALGAALFQRIQAMGWAQREPGSRAVVFTPAGETALRGLFPSPGSGDDGVRVAAEQDVAERKRAGRFATESHGYSAGADPTPMVVSKGVK